MMKKVQPAVKKEIVLFDFGQTITVQAIIQGLEKYGLYCKFGSSRLLEYVSVYK